MRSIVTMVLLVLLPVPFVSAEPITLKCTTDNGSPAADLIVNVPNRTLSWAHREYTITFIDERYISAYEQSNDAVGGEVWVFDRNSGEYLRAGVGIFWSTPDAVTKEPGKLTANTYSGKCVRPML